MFCAKLEFQTKPNDYCEFSAFALCREISAVRANG